MISKIVKLTPKKTIKMLIYSHINPFDNFIFSFSWNWIVRLNSFPTKTKHFKIQNFALVALAL